MQSFTSSNVRFPVNPKYCRECGRELIERSYLGGYYLMCPKYAIDYYGAHDKYNIERPIKFDPNTGKPVGQATEPKWEHPRLGGQFIGVGTTFGSDQIIQELPTEPEIPKPKWLERVKNWLKQSETDK